MSSSSAGAREALHSENVGRRQGDLARGMLAIQGGCRAREHGRPTGKPSARCGGAARLPVFFQGRLTQVSRILGFVQRPGFFAPTPRSYAGCSGKVAKAPGHPIFPVFRQFRRACRAVLRRARCFHRSCCRRFSSLSVVSFFRNAGQQANKHNLSTLETPSS